LEFGKQAGHKAIGLLTEGEQQMFGIHLLMATRDGDILCLLQGLLGHLCALIQVHVIAPSRIVCFNIPGDSFFTAEAQRSQR
jgi:hypothetical protein